MVMSRSLYYFTGFFLPARSNVHNPLIGQDLMESGSLFRIYLEHPSDNISAFTWQNAQQPPWSLNDFLTLPRRGGR